MNETNIINKKEKSLNRHWKNFVDKDYLGSHNLENGEEMLLTIAKFVGEEQVTGADGKKDNKIVLYFQEQVPKMILNITNAGTISNLYGTHPDGWVGKQIQLYATPVRAFGKTQEALRIRDFIPQRVVPVAEFIVALRKTINIGQLKTMWKGFPVSARNNPELEAVKNELKANFEKQNENNT